MNITALHARNYRSYSEVDLVLPDGAVALVGPNAAGKSSLVELIPLVLFGPESRSLAPYLSDDEPDAALVIQVDFEHAGSDFRIRRTYSPKGRGSTKVDFEELVAGAWEPRTQGTAADTQAEIERVLGLSRETFCASAFLSQGDGAAFSDAQPRDRKRILSNVLGLDSYDRLLALVSPDRRAAERSLAETDGRIALLSERGGDVAALGEAKLRAEEVVADRERAHSEADQRLVAASEQVATIERADSAYRTAQSAVETARARLAERQGIVDRAAQAKTEAVQVQAELDRIGDPSAEVAALEAKLADARAQAERRREAESVRDRYLADAEETRRQVSSLSEEMRRVDMEHRALAAQAEDLNRAGAEHRCPTCEQVLAGESHAVALTRIREGRDDAARRIEAYSKRIGEAQMRMDSRRAAAEQVEIPEAPNAEEVVWLEQGLRSARQAEITVAQARERLRALEATIAELTPEVMTEIELLNVAHSDAQAALAAIDEPEPGALDAAKVAAVTAKAELDIAARSLTEARENLIRATSALEQAQAVASDLAEARARREELVAEIEILTTLERAYGRDGIPALIVEASAIPQIEAEGNRILAELGTAYRVELRTQRELKSSDGLADTLDVVVIGEAGARPYETFSGGERSRLNVSLRIALARLLAHRRGAESRVLVLDEVEYLDEAGQAALAGVLLELSRTEFDKVITVSHATTLRDVFDNCITVEKVDGRSVIAA